MSKRKTLQVQKVRSMKINSRNSLKNREDSVERKYIIIQKMKEKIKGNEGDS